MKKTLFIFIVLILPCIVNAQKFIHATYIVGHSLSSTEKVKKIDYKKFQFIYLMAAPKWNEKDFTQSEDEIIRELVIEHQYKTDKNVEVIPLLIEEAHKQGSKVLLSFAGEGFNPIVSSNEKQQKFINMMIRFVEKYNYDGIEIDWETNLETVLHAEFLSNIRTKLDSLEKVNNKKYFMTTALHAWHIYDQELANKLSSSVDWINIMAYDMGGGDWGGIPTHNTPFDEIKRELKNWNVFDYQKLCVGLANYGYLYRGLKPNENIQSDESVYGNYFSYNELCSLLQENWIEEYDADAEVSYFFSPDRSDFGTIENPRSILNKIRWITEKQYRGVFWWEFGFDAVNPNTETGKIRNQLIDVVDDYLKSISF